MQSYMLDFETMKQVMIAHHKTGHLSAKVPSGVAGLREPCSAAITVTAGNMVMCSIVGASGRSFTGKKAVLALEGLGELELHWTFTAQPEAAAQQENTVSSAPVLPASTPREGAIFPIRVARVEQSQLRTWPRLHRAVFALADGTKPVAKIAEMLSTSPELVKQAVRDLRSLGILASGPQNGKNSSKQ